MTRTVRVIPQPNPVEPMNPAGRVDLLVNRTVNVAVARWVDTHPLAERLKQVGLDVGFLIRGYVEHRLKKEKITDIRSLRRALRR